MKLLQIIMAIIIVLYAYSSLTEQDEVNQLSPPAVHK